MVALHTRSIVGGVIRAVLIVFALSGTPHLVRVIFNQPSLSDLYPVWLGSRELLVHHRNPYSPDISREIQIAFYGAELGPGDHPDQECCFAYPVYVSVILAPSVKSDFPSLQPAALIFLAVVTAIQHRLLARSHPARYIRSDIRHTPYTREPSGHAGARTPAARDAGCRPAVGIGNSG